MENGKGADVSVLVWSRAAAAAGSELRAYLDQASAATLPKDTVHLRNQELVIGLAAGGRWRPVPEAAIDADRTRSRAADVLLVRDHERALIEVWDWLDDVGTAFRAFDRKLATVARTSIARLPPNVDELPIVSGCWLLRATRRNRALVAAHPLIFAARFPAIPGQWLHALTDSTAQMPRRPGLLWVSVDGARVWPSRVGRGRDGRHTSGR